MSTLASTEFVRRILLGAAVIIAVGHSVRAQAPTITTHPVTQALAPGASATLSVVATGSGPLTYQWSRNGVALPGATNPTYAITGARLADVGRYSVAVTDAAGTSTSAPAQVSLSGLLWAVGTTRMGSSATARRSTEQTPCRFRVV
jgi:hypothetical protein